MVWESACREWDRADRAGGQSSQGGCGACRLSGGVTVESRDTGQGLPGGTFLSASAGPPPNTCLARVCCVPLLNVAPQGTHPHGLGVLS